jgi:hypothetical protein
MRRDYFPPGEISPDNGILVQHLVSIRQFDVSGRQLSGLLAGEAFGDVGEFSYTVVRNG